MVQTISFFLSLMFSIFRNNLKKNNNVKGNKI